MANQNTKIPFKNNALCLFFATVTLIFSVPHLAEARTHHHKKALHHHSHAGVARTASYADIVIDAETGQIIHATNPDSLRHPASLTKMMTLYITFQALEAGKLGLNQYLPISANAAAQSPSKLGLHHGQRIRVGDAILGLVTESANDAAVVLAEWMGGSESGFAQLMTRQAHALGMSRTRFDNPSGLPDDDQVTTAHDMAVLGAALIHHFPQFYPYFSHDSFTYAGINHHNHNHLMERYEGMDGIKTGYIRASGFNLVASAVRSHQRLIGVVFGGHSATARDNQMAQLLDDCFAKVQHGPDTNRVAMTTNQGEGDANEGDEGETESGTGGYVKLPAKIAAVFSPTRAVDNIHPLPPAAPTPAPAAPTSSDDASPRHDIRNWGVQIGAYSDEVVGHQALTNVVAMMPALLSGVDQQLTPISTSGGSTAYRARLMNVDPQTAQAVCGNLVRQGINCLTVGP